MSKVADFIRSLGSEHGVEFSDNDLAELDGSLPREAPDDDVLDQEIPGSAQAVLEVFSDEFSKTKPVEKDGLLWEPIMREGQWAMRPGPRGQKVRKRMRIVAGKSKNQLKEIGLQDIVDAFDDDAVEHVTVPETHDNDWKTNGGFIRGLKILNATVTKGPMKGKSVPHLFGGYDLTDDTFKNQFKTGGVAGRSAGLLYSYTNTETGTTYPVVLEHVTPTNRPWITGMKPNGRKLAASHDVEVVGMSFSDSDPGGSSEDEIAESFAAANDSSADATWDQEESPNWLRQQFQQILDERRDEKRKALAGQGKDPWQEGLPSYRCVEAVPGKALVADGWSDDSNFWVAPFEVDAGTMTASPFGDWSPYKKAYVPDIERKAPPKAKQPLARSEPDADDPRRAIKLAQASRRERAKPAVKTDHEHPRGGDEQDMDAPQNGGTATLSEEQAAEVAELRQKLADADEKNETLERRVERLSATDTVNKAEALVAELKGIGFTEDRGFSGLLAEARQIALADDGEPAVQSAHFADEATNKDGVLSATDIVRRLFSAIEKGEDGKVKLGEQLTQPTDTEVAGEKGKDGKEAPPDGADGKPPKGETETELSVKEKVDETFADGQNPAFAAVVGYEPPKPKEGETT